MSRTAILKNSAQQEAVRRSAPLTETLARLDRLKQDLQQTDRMAAEQPQALAVALIPIAAAVATLTDQMRTTLRQAEARTATALEAAEKARQSATVSAKAADTARRAIEGATKALAEAAKARPVMDRLAPWIAAAMPLLATLWLARQVGVL